MMSKKGSNQNGKSSEKELRRKAIELYDQDLKASETYASLHCFCLPETNPFLENRYTMLMLPRTRHSVKKKEVEDIPQDF